jgi:hypothetical protein
MTDTPRHFWEELHATGRWSAVTAPDAPATKKVAGVLRVRRGGTIGPRIRNLTTLSPDDAGLTLDQLAAKYGGGETRQ